MTTLNVVEILTKAKQLISNPENWHQGWYNNGDVNSDGEPTCFCSLGAIAHVMDVDYFSDKYNHVEKFLRETVVDEIDPGLNFATYNDNHTHTEVMEAFEKAIELAKVEAE